MSARRRKPTRGQEDGQCRQHEIEDRDPGSGKEPSIESAEVQRVALSEAVRATLSPEPVSPADAATTEAPEAGSA